jgi:N-acetylmuramoyl-L-alanine amidase
VKISQETGEAVERALEGEDISEGALYFVARKYADSEKIKWFDRNLTFLFEHGGHEFFR